MSDIPVLNDEEQAAMDKILAAGDAILVLGLSVNQTEFTMHVHGLQTFVVQHMLHRVAPEKWSAWYDSEPSDD